MLHILVYSACVGNTHTGCMAERFRITEQFNDLNEKVDVTVLTERLNDREFTFSVKRFRMTVARTIHLYSPEDGRSRFYVETVVDVDVPIIGWFINWAVIPFPFLTTTTEHQIRNNIEETGRSKSVIPVLYNYSHDLQSYDG